MPSTLVAVWREPSGYSGEYDNYSGDYDNKFAKIGVQTHGPIGVMPRIVARLSKPLACVTPDR